MKLPLTFIKRGQQPTATRRWLIGITAIALFAGILLIQRHASAPAQHASPSVSAMTVTGVTAESASWRQTIDASGPIAAWQEAVIGSQLAGQRLVKLLVDVGDTVKKGQPLAIYDADILLAQKAELEANWLQADSDQKRAVKLKQSGAMSAQMIDSYISKAAIAKARLDAKNLEITYATVVAPEDGVISSRTATIGEVGSPGKELFKLIVDNRIEWRGEVTARQLADIKEGQQVALTLPDGSKAHATIRRLSPAFNAQSRMAIVYADLQPGSFARPGMYANGTIEIGDKQVVTVPSASVVIRDGYNYVFKLPNQNGAVKVSRVEIRTGRHQGDKLEVIAGLHAGDRVADKGAGFLKDGDTVNLIAKPDTHA